MTGTATVRVMSAEEIAAQGGGQPPFLNWPERSTVFAERAMRLTQRATSGHPMADYLQFIAAVANEQQQVLAAFGDVPLPDKAALDAAALAGKSPLDVEQWPRDAAWRTGLMMLLTNLRPRVPGPVQSVIDRVQAMPADDLERQAGRLLTGVMQGIDMAAAPLIAAALQVYWTHMLLAVRQAQSGDGEPFGRIADERLCPCCGSRPTTSIIRNGGAIQGQRYLHCSLCGLEWHQARIRCMHCLSSKAIAFQALDTTDPDAETVAGAAADDGANPEPGPGFRTISSPEAANRAARAAVQAETCDECGHYLKLLHADRDPFLEPVADDLATLALDLLVSEAGLNRHGVNLMLLIGAADDEPPGSPPRPPEPGGH